MAVDDSYTKSLLHFDGADASNTFTDESGKSWTAYDNAQLDTAQKVFGTASGLFDGTSDYILSSSVDDWDFGTGDFTIDFWVRRNGTPDAFDGIVSVASNGNNNGWAICFDNTSTTKISFFNANSVRVASTNTISDLTWTHVACVRYGNTVTMYLDGVANGTYDATGISVDDVSNNGIVIGRLYTDSTLQAFSGWIDELRISKGIARWTSDFTPPTSEYAPVVSTFIPKVIWF